MNATATPLRISRAALTESILAVLAEFCCYAGAQEILSAVERREGCDVPYWQVFDVLQSLVAHRRIHKDGRQYCIADTTPAPPPVSRRGPKQIRSDAEIAAVVQECRGDRKQAAEKLGIGLTTIYKRARTRPEVSAAIKGSKRRKATDEQIRAAIEKFGNYREAAEFLGVSKALIYQRARKIDGIAKPRKNKPPEVRRQPRRPVRIPPPALALASTPEPTSRTAPPALPPPPPGLDLDQLWQHYRTDRGLGVRNAIAEHYLWLVQQVAMKMAKRLPEEVDPEELISAGHFGLLEAIERFDPDRAVKFKSYAWRIIQGRIADELRNQDWTPRLVRVRGKLLTKASEAFYFRTGRQPSAAELADELQMPLAAVEQLIKETRPVGVDSLDRTRYFNDEGATISAATTIEDTRGCDPTRRQFDSDLLRTITRGLNQNERLLIISYYIEDQTMFEIAESLGLSESRVSQMHKEILLRLRSKLGSFERVA